MNESNPYTREQRRKGMFVIEQKEAQVFVHGSLLVRFLEWLRIRNKKERTVSKYLSCPKGSTQPNWVYSVSDATPFKFDIAHTFVNELDLKEATVKNVVKFNKEFVAV
jgi:hypothetical protein